VESLKLSNPRKLSIQPFLEELKMGIRKTPGELFAKSVLKKKLSSSKSVLGRKRKADVSEAVT
jgi:hypothetical protein